MLANPLRDVVFSTSSDCIRELPADTATLDVTDRDDGLTQVTITPTRASAAPITLAVQKGTVTVVLGQCTTVELLGDATQLRDDLRAFFQCAFDGKIQERVWRRNGKVIRCVSRVVVDGKESRFGSVDPLDFAPFSRAAIEDYVYDRYCDSR